VAVAHRHKKIKIGYDYVHTAIDDHTRLAYSEVLPDEKDPTCAAFLHRALAWFTGHGIHVRRVLTDNAMVYRHGGDWGWVCTAWQLKRRFTKPGCPWTNGKAERFNRTLLTEWAYARPWTSKPCPHPCPGHLPALLQHSTRPLHPRRSSTHHQARRLTTTCQVHDS
jgi:transposase InsO family protein